MDTDMTIFYLDDDVDDQEIFKGMANQINDKISVVTHDHGDELIDALYNPPPTPQIIFLDLNMPGKNGFEVLEEVRSNEQTKDVPVVIFSTSKDEESIKKTWNLGANLYLPKSNSFEAFQDALQFTFNIDWKNFKPSYNNFLYSS